MTWPAALTDRADALKGHIGAPGSAAADQFDAALLAEIGNRLGRLETGIRGYRQHRYRRDLAEPPVVWQRGGVRLLDYGLGGGGTPVLVVPSLVNRAYVLDLSEKHSLLRWLAGRGVRPYLLDWGAPGDAERGFDLTGYIAQRLEPALGHLVETTGAPVRMLGYCMGGLLAVAAVLRRPEAVSRLALLATPWDFHCDDEARLQAATLQAAVTPWWPLFDRLGEVPVDAVQVLFSMADPMQVPRKFMDFAGMAMESARAEQFVALEDWLNDGIPLAAPVARACADEWYGANAPAAGAWRVGRTVIRAEDVMTPSLVLVPQKDRIVPPASAAALATAMKAGGNGKVGMAQVPLGHIGMIVGSQARSLVWEPLLQWLGDD